MAAVDWAKYARLSAAAGTDAEKTRQLAEQLAAEAGVAPDAAALALSALAQAATPSASSSSSTTYVAPLLAHQNERAEDAKREHDARAAAVTDVVAAAAAQRVIHDESPLLNLFSWDAYTSRLENLRAAFPQPEFTHAVAVKANPLRGVLRGAQERGFGAECASFAEAKHSLSLGFPPRKVVYDSPCKTLGELEHLLLAGVYINLDNEEEVRKINAVFASTGGFDDKKHGAQIGLRINPVVGGGSIDATSTATVTSKFGLPLTADTHERLMSIFLNNPWLQGVHVHVGSQGCPLDLLAKGAQRAVRFAREVNERAGKQQIKVLDIGGGMPTVYDGGEREAFDFKEYAASVVRLVPEMFTSGFSAIITEFGRSVFVKPGITVSKVEAIKDWAGQRIAVIHVGADQFPRTAYLPELWSHTISVLGPDGKPKSDVPASEYVKQDIAGPLCFSGDFMAKQLLLPPIKVGDLVVVHDTGGYTMSMHSKYNSRQVGATYAYSSAKATGDGVKFALLKERETAEEALSGWGIDGGVTFAKH